MATILIVDDDHDVARVIGDRVQAAGYDVALAAHGREALTILGNGHPEIVGVLLDIQMPVMDGLDTLRAIRARFPRLPVIMMSAIARPRIVQELHRLGAQDFLVKTGDLSALVERCRTVFSSRADEAAP